MAGERYFQINLNQPGPLSEVTSVEPGKLTLVTSTYDLHDACLAGEMFGSRSTYGNRPIPEIVEGDIHKWERIECLYEPLELV